MFAVTFCGKPIKQAAVDFKRWYDGGGEQHFYDCAQDNASANVDVSDRGEKPSSEFEDTVWVKINYLTR